MTPGEEGQVIALLDRIATALERLADKFAPAKGARPRHAAVLGTATYSREERDKKELRETLHGRTPKVQI